MYDLCLLKPIKLPKSSNKSVFPTTKVCSFKDAGGSSSP